MKNVYIIAGAVAAEPATAARDPRYRKASRNMVLADTSIARVLAGLPLDVVIEDCGYVLGSCRGELEVTVDFLKTYSETGVARPILFQNSLHNSTTGFVCMNWKIHGPMMTVSDLYFTGEDALETAACLIRSNQCRGCLVTGVEARVAELAEEVPGRYAGEGAATVLLAGEELVRRLDVSPRGELVAIQRFVHEGTSLPLPDGYYESDAIERLVRALETGDREVTTPKPGGRRSVIVWR